MHSAIEQIINNLTNGLTSHLKFPYSICNKNVLANQKALQCDLCKTWTHIKCDGTSSVTYSQTISKRDPMWECLLCSVSFNHANIPFTFCDNAEISNINNSNSMTFLDSLPEFEINTVASKFSNFQAYELDLNMAYQNDCEYYPVSEFKKMKLKKNFNIFHSNVNKI